jgi:hypothetical protein
MICSAKDLRKTLKVVLTQVVMEIPEGGMIHSGKEGKALVLAKLGVVDENHWGVYDRGVSVFTNNLSSVVFELKKKGILAVPKPLHWSRPAVQESLFLEKEEEVIIEEKNNIEEEKVIIEEEKVITDLIEEEVILEEEDAGLSMTVEEKHLLNQVNLKGMSVLAQAIKDMGGYYGSSEGGCYGGYGKLPVAICEGGVYKGKMLKPCALRSFCKNVR